MILKSKGKCHNTGLSLRPGDGYGRIRQIRKGSGNAWSSDRVRHADCRSFANNLTALKLDPGFMVLMIAAMR